MAVTVEIGRQKKLLDRVSHEILFENSLDALEAKQFFGIGDDVESNDIDNFCRLNPKIIPHVKLDKGTYIQNGENIELKTGEKYYANLVRFHPDHNFLVMMPLVKIS